MTILRQDQDYNCQDCQLRAVREVIEHSVQENYPHSIYFGRTVLLMTLRWSQDKDPDVSLESCNHTSSSVLSRLNGCFPGELAGSSGINVSLTLQRHSLTSSPTQSS